MPTFAVKNGSISAVATTWGSCMPPHLESAAAEAAQERRSYEHAKALVVPFEIRHGGVGHTKSSFIEGA